MRMCLGPSQIMILVQKVDKASGLAYNTDLDIGNIDTAKPQCFSFANYIHSL